MNIRLTLTLIASKLAIKACRLFKLGGTSLPGEIARKMYPGILTEITKGYRIIMVTGTNGKTTTTKIIGKILEENGIDYITNKSGANLVDGVTTTFIDSIGINGKHARNTALIEIDEAAFNKLTDFVKPDVLVVTNFFRDQLDRYGELYTTLSKVKSGISKSPDAKLVLNADDSLCASLGKDAPNESVYFGMAPEACEPAEEEKNLDAAFCLYCKSKYEYSFHVYGHLGGFRCPNCGYERPEVRIMCTKVDMLTSSDSYIQFAIKDDGQSEPWKASYASRINLPGMYNVYNAMAAIACGHVLNLPAENTIKALGSVESSFGRMESIVVDNKRIKIILVKNPAGFNLVLNFLLTENQNIQLAFAINDKIADGTDISWLWDVDFEKLLGMQDKLDNIYATGLRAEDMALRLKYAGLYTNKISIIKSYDELISTGLIRTKEGSSFYILPTYTAMLEIRKLLKKRFKLKDFWK